MSCVGWVVFDTTSRSGLRRCLRRSSCCEMLCRFLCVVSVRSREFYYSSAGWGGSGLLPSVDAGAKRRSAARRAGRRGVLAGVYRSGVRASGTSAALDELSGSCAGATRWWCGGVRSVGSFVAAPDRGHHRPGRARCGVSIVDREHRRHDCRWEVDLSRVRGTGPIRAGAGARRTLAGLAAARSRGRSGVGRPS